MKNKYLITSVIFLFAFTFSFRLKASTYYWVGNGGDWKDYATHWATSSGGSTFHTQVPTPADDVIFDANSFTTTGQLITLDTSSSSFYCHDMDWTGVTNLPTFGDINNIDNFLLHSTVRVYGSFTLSAGMLWEFNGFISFEATTAGNIINTHNHPRLGDVYFNSSTGGWQLASSFRCQNIYMLNGSLNTMGDSLSCVYGLNAVESSPFTLLLGTSVVRAEYAELYSPALSIDGDSATFSCGEFHTRNGQHYKKVIISSFVTQLAVIGDSLTIGELEAAEYPDILYIACKATQFAKFTCHTPAMLYYSNSYGNATFYKDLTTDAANTFDTLDLSNANYTCAFKAGSTSTILSALLSTAGPCSGFVNVRSTQSGVQATLSKASGTVTCSNLSLQDINATGGASFIANNSIAGSNVSGWTVNAPTSRTLYWVGGTGNWSDQAHWSTTSNGPGGNCPPTLNDNAFFNAYSFSLSTDTLYIDVPQARCDSMIWTGAIPAGVTVWSSGPSSDNIGIYGSLKLKGTLNWQYPGILSFPSSAAGNTIQAPGLFLPHLVFNGTGSWSFLNNVNSTSIDLQSGNLYTLNHSIHCLSFSSVNYTTRGFHAGTSSVFCRDWSISGSNLLMDGDSATFHLQNLDSGIPASYGTVILALSTTYPDGNIIMNVTGTDASIDTLIAKDMMGTYAFNFSIGYARFKDNASFNGDAIHFGTAEFRRNLVTSVSVTADTFFLATGGYTVTLGSGTTVSTNHFITSSTCNGYTTLRADNPGSPGHISVPSGTVNCSSLIIDGISATGGATFNASNSLVLSSASGWNILSSPSPQTLYWVNGTGNWNSAAHWSTSSGGAPGACQPTFLDDVVFDSNSFSSSTDTVNVNATSAYCHNMTWSTSGTPMVYNSALISSSLRLTIFGSLTLSPGIDWNYRGQIFFAGSGTSKTITSSGVVLKELYFQSNSSAWTLQDSLSCEWLEQDNGSLNTAGNTVNAYRCQFNGPLQAGTSLFRTGYFVNYAPDLQYDGDSASIECSYFEGHSQHYNIVRMANTSFSEFYGEHCTINDFSCLDNMRFYNSHNNTFISARFYGSAEVSGHQDFGTAEFNGDLNLLGNNSFGTLKLYNAGQSTTLESDSTQTVNLSLLVNSGPSGQVSIGSSSPGTAANLACMQDTVCLDYLSVHDLAASGPALFFAGANSTDLGNNTNILFTACSIDTSGRRILYWVNGTGNWDDTLHWSTLSGGAGNQSPPNANDDVVFDTNSFLTSTDTVNLDHLPASCHDMNWQISGTPVVYDDAGDLSPRQLEVSGDLRLDTGISWSYPRPLILNGYGASKTITTAAVLLKDVYVNSPFSSWIMQDSIACDSFHLANGSLNTGGNNINCAFNCALGSTVQLHHSVIRTLNFTNTATNTQFHGDSSTVECSYFKGNGQHYHIVRMGNVPAPEFHGQHCTISSYSASDGLTFSLAANNTFNTAKFSGAVEIAGHETFGTAEFNGATTLLGNNAFDTLKFYNAGYNVILEADSAQSVYLSLLVNSGAMASISFNSNSSADASLTCYQDTVCIDYTVLQYINANGPAVFYAGANSTDNGNNVNIRFTECGSASSARDAGLTIQETGQPASQLMTANETQLFPNPTNTNARLVFSIPLSEAVSIEVYDITGKCIYREEKGKLQAGNYSEIIPAETWKPGIYNCRILSGTQLQSLRLVKVE